MWVNQRDTDTEYKYICLILFRIERQSAQVLLQYDIGINKRFPVGSTVRLLRLLHEKKRH